MRGILYTIIAILTISSCAQKKEEINISVSPASVEIPAEGSEFQIYVTGTDRWETYKLPEWIEITKVDGNASVKVAPNDSFYREHELIFHYGLQTASVAISQLGSELFTVTPTDLQADYKGGQFSIDIECYDDWRVSELSDWMHLNISEGDGPQQITLSISKNYKTSKRHHTLHFISGEKVLEMAVAQGAGPNIALEKDVVNMNGDGGFAEILFMSDTDVKITSDSDWIRLVNINHDIRKVTFEVLRNTAEARQGHMTISSETDPEFFKILTVIQGDKIPHPKITFEEASNITVSDNAGFTLHPVFTDMDDTSLTWSSDRPEIATVDSNGKVSVFCCGKCTITARNNFHDISASVNLTVKIKAESIKMKLGEQDLHSNPIAVRFIGETLGISLTPYPENAYKEDFVIISSDPTIAEIDGYKIRCLKSGNVYITVESPYNNISNRFQLFILKP